MSTGSRRRLRVSVAGFGRIGRLHLRHLLRLAEVVEVLAVCDPRREPREEAGAQFGIKTYADLGEMLTREKPEAVVVTTPSATHGDVIEEAAGRGVHVFCEKPLALTRAEALRAARAIADGRILFQIGFQRRFDRAYREARQIIGDGLIGELLTFKSIGRDTWKPELQAARDEVNGGLLLDMAIHDFDLARWLMGSEVVRVSAEGSHLLYPELESVRDSDNAVVNLRFASGAVGNVEASRTGTYGYDIRTEVVGSKGALFVGQVEEGALVAVGQGGSRQGTYTDFEARFVDAYVAELEDFSHCVLEGRAPECGVRDGVISLEVALAARESLRRGSPVEVEPTPEV